MAAENRKESVKNRVIVTHTGVNPWTGEWRCSKDSREWCSHKTKAQKRLAELLGAKESDADGGHILGQDLGTNLSELPLLKCSLICMAPAEIKNVKSPRGIPSISHRAVLVPSWARICPPSHLQLRLNTHR